MKFKIYYFEIITILLALAICAIIIIYRADKATTATADHTASLEYVKPSEFTLPELDVPDSKATGFKKPSSNKLLGALMSTEATLEATLEATIQATTEAVTETVTETSNEAVTEAFTEAITETSNEASTKATTETTSPDTTTVVTGFEEGDHSSNHPYVTVTTDYFDDAVFIGNSRLMGFVLYSKLPNLRAYTYVGMNVSTYFSKESFEVNGKTLTAADALASDPSFSKVYLKLGINEIGWTNTERFVEAYQKIIEHIYSVNPTCTIFIHSVLPVSQRACENDPNLDNALIIEYNNALRSLADQFGCCYLDVASLFVDENGYMNTSYSSDGVHLNAGSILTWVDYLLQHGIQ